MADKKKSSDTVVAELNTLEQAEIIRNSLVKDHPERMCVYVYIPVAKEDPWRVAVSTEWGTAIKEEKAIEVMDHCAAVMADWGPDILGYDPTVPAEEDTEYVLNIDLDPALVALGTEEETTEKSTEKI